MENLKSNAKITIIASAIAIITIIIFTNVIWFIACQNNPTFQYETPGVGLEPPVSPASAWNGLLTSNDPLFIMVFILSILSMSSSLVAIVCISELLERINVIESAITGNQNIDISNAEITSVADDNANENKDTQESSNKEIKEQTDEQVPDQTTEQTEK